MKSLILDNFLPYPNLVRSWALNQPYYNSEQMSQLLGSYTSWPGLRTSHVVELDTDYANVILNQICHIVENTFAAKRLSIRSYFQLCRKNDGDSWVHQDNDVDLAGILYLSPQAPMNSGTSLYHCRDTASWQSLNIDQMKKINSQENSQIFESLFEVKDSFANVYNRLVLYSGQEFHKSNNYFGETIETSRLTQVFFIKFES